jgi:hypothetical protein
MKLKTIQRYLPDQVPNPFLTGIDKEAHRRDEGRQYRRDPRRLFRCYATGTVFMKDQTHRVRTQSGRVTRILFSRDAANLDSGTGQAHLQHCVACRAQSKDGSLSNSIPVGIIVRQVPVVIP